MILTALAVVRLAKGLWWSEAHVLNTQGLVLLPLPTAPLMAVLLVDIMVTMVNMVVATATPKCLASMAALIENINKCLPRDTFRCCYR
jgi:hypothetical protein